MKYSIIVPIFKVEKYLKKCIDSILNQTYKDFEVILVDDGSPDGCPIICDEYSEIDKRVHVIHKSNGGLVNARNTGVITAKGDYICYVDGDDWIEPNLLEKVYIKGIEPNNPDMIVFGAKRCFDNREIKIPAGLGEGLYNKKALEKFLYPYMIYDNRKPFYTGLIFPVAWNKIYKRELLLEHYCKEEQIRMGEDNAFVFECLYYSYTVYFCEDILYCYNQLNSESMVHSYDKNRFRNNRLLIDYLEEKLEGKDKKIDFQLNAFKAYWLIMAIFHEIKTYQKLSYSCKHIKNEIKKYRSIDRIQLNKLPPFASIFIILLRLRLYAIVLILSKLVNSKRKK